MKKLVCRNGDGQQVGTSLPLDDEVVSVEVVDDELERRARELCGELRDIQEDLDRVHVQLALFTRRRLKGSESRVVEDVVSRQGAILTTAREAVCRTLAALREEGALRTSYQSSPPLYWCATDGPERAA